MVVVNAYSDNKPHSRKSTQCIPFTKYKYDAYGNPSTPVYTATALVTAIQAQTIGEMQPLRYAGYYYDRYSGLYYCSQRYYDPQTASFLSLDPIKADGQRSGYMYCQGDPVGSVDPSGLRKLVFPKIILPKMITKTAIYAAASVFLTANKCYIARDMFYHALYGNGKPLSAALKSRIVAKMKDASEIKSGAKKMLDRSTGKIRKYLPSTRWSVEFNQNTNADLYFGIQKANASSIGRRSGRWWQLDTTISDRYDFDNYRLLQDVKFSSAANDLGRTMQKANWLKPYNWSVKFTHYVWK
jgi:RHS repeat-associated protein